MDMNCHQCGHQGAKADFKLLHQANSAGADTFRRCPACLSPVYCEEVADQREDTKAWGAGPMRGQVFTRKKKSNGTES